MVFAAKKVDVSLSFGEKLKKAREGVNLSKEKAAQILNIRVDYLERLECGEIEKLPAGVYIRGILRKYGKLLGIEQEELFTEYEKEARIARHLSKKREHRALPILYSNRFVVTPRVFKLFFLSLIFLTVAGYLFYQLYFLIGPPKLAVFEPAGDLTTSYATVILKGKTEPGVKLTINGELTYIGKDGSFEQAVNLNQGLNVIKVEATNRFGKSSSAVRQIMVKNL